MRRTAANTSNLVVSCINQTRLYHNVAVSETSLEIAAVESA
jgi:hypothetical protein